MVRFIVLFFIVLIFPMSVQAEASLCSMIKEKDGVNYTPGVNVKGASVAPADLNDDFAKTLYPIKIPIEVDLIERFGLNVGNGTVLEPVIAHFDIHEDGRVMYGSKDLTNKAQELCDLPKENEHE